MECTVVITWHGGRARRPPADGPVRPRARDATTLHVKYKYNRIHLSPQKALYSLVFVFTPRPPVLWSAGIFLDYLRFSRSTYTETTRNYQNLHESNMLPNSASSSFMLSSRLGMETPGPSASKKRDARKSTKAREGVIWDTVSSGTT